MVSATSSHGWPTSEAPTRAMSAAPVRASPIPITIVPWACIHRRKRTSGCGLSAAARRVRSANGRRIDGRKRPTARTMWVVRTMGNQAGMPSDCRSGLVERPSAPHRLERDPITLVPDLADVEPSPGEGDPDFGQTIREDPRRNDLPVTPELRREGRGEVDEERRDEIRAHDVERHAV